VVALRYEHGFTLLEILVALAILATAMGALIKGGSESAAGISHLRNKSYAHWVAQNQIIEQQLQQSWFTQSHLSGEEKLAGEHWPWRLRVSKTFDEDIQRLDIDVWLHEDSGKPLTSVTAFLVRPLEPTKSEQ
jgi:general secretion pathway protein I